MWFVHSNDETKVIIKWNVNMHLGMHKESVVANINELTHNFERETK